MKTQILAILVATTCLGPAQQQKSPFDSWDQNKDGKLSRDELPPGPRRNFDRVDTNGDGSVSKAEDRAFRDRGKKQAELRNKIEHKRDLKYADTDNPRQKLDLYLPKERANKDPLPLVVFIHGGAWRAGDKRSGDRRLTALVASGDFAGASIGYRLSDEAIWPAQIHDCKAAIRWLRANAKKYNLDPEKIGVWGTSAGGHLVAMLGVSDGVDSLEGKLGGHTNVSSKVKCVANYFGPSELLTMGDHPSAMDHNAPDSPESKLIGGTLQENKKKARNASPITFVSKDDAAFLNVHGTDDKLVPYPQSVDFNARLKKAGVESSLLTIEGGGHGGFGRATAKVEQFTREFFVRHLRGKDSADPPKDRKLQAK